MRLAGSGTIQGRRVECTAGSGGRSIRGSGRAWGRACRSRQPRFGYGVADLVARLLVADCIGEACYGAGDGQEELGHAESSTRSEN